MASRCNEFTTYNDIGRQDHIVLVQMFWIVSRCTVLDICMVRYCIDVEETENVRRIICHILSLILVTNMVERYHAKEA
jgi:hypothetical protein